MGQRKVLQMDVRLKLMKHYKKDTHPESGNHIEYDSKQLREDPQKLERWTTQREAPPESTQKHTAAEARGAPETTHTQSNQGGISAKISTPRSKRTGMVKKAQQWIAKKNGETYKEIYTDEHYIKTPHETRPKSNKETARNTANKILDAWKQEARYTRPNKERIEYADTPDYEPTDKQRKDQKKP